MYGENYGYRSGLNQSMVDHLTRKIRHLERLVPTSSRATSCSTSAATTRTSLKAYTTSGIERIGIDPTGPEVPQLLPDDIRLVPDFFSAAALTARSTRKPARIVTSIAMFYDLEDPVEFARAGRRGAGRRRHLALRAELHAVDAAASNSYDTICHEHLEYYSLGVVKSILDAAGLQDHRRADERGQRRQLRRDRGQARARRMQAEPRGDRLAAGAGGADGAATRRGPSAISRSACSAIARICAACCRR